MADTTFLVRLKPYNEKKGHRTRVYMVDGLRFYEERGWYEVTPAIADSLRELRQDHYDLETPYLFDVVTPDQAEKIDEREALGKIEAKASARRPEKLPRTRVAQVLPANNAGPLDEITGGDTTTADILGRSATVNDDEDAVDDSGRLTSVGRVEGAAPGPKTRRRK